MRRCNIQILLLTFPGSAICTRMAVFIRSRAWGMDGNPTVSGWARHRSITATGFMDRNSDGLLSEASRGGGCLTTMVVGFSNLGSVVGGLLLHFESAKCAVRKITC